MASNLQTKNFPKGSYRAYTNLLKQFSGPDKSTTPLPPTAKQSPVMKEAKLPTLSNSNGVTKTVPLNIEALQKLTNGEIDMLDTAVLRQFLELLTKENQSNDKSSQMMVDANNNNDQQQDGLSVDELHIESSKHTLIQSLKAQLERYRQH